GWRKGEGTTLESGGSLAPPGEQSNNLSSSTSGVSGSRSVDPPSSPSMESTPSGPSFGTSPSAVAEAVLRRTDPQTAPSPPADVRAELPALVDDRPVVASPGATAAGNIQTTPVVHMLVYVLDHGTSGTTELVEPSGEKHFIYFQRGTPAKVKTR